MVHLIPTTSHVIPLVIDYILEYTMAEEKTLALILQLNENEINKALSILTKMKILDSQDMNTESFKRNHAQKLGV